MAFHANIGLITGTKTNYRNDVNNFVQWNDNNYLNLNIVTTKELIVDFRSKKVTIFYVEITDETV